MASKDDEEFLHSFENCSLNSKCWNHAAHVRMAWLQLQRASSFEEALERIRTGIMRFNTTVNSVGYHETVTVAFARLIRHRQQLSPEVKSWQEFLDKYSDLVSKEQPILHHYYSAEVLSDTQARVSFAEPDRKPLPAIGVLRMATEQDASQLLSIYAPYIEESVASFETCVPSEGEFRKRISDTLNIAPWLVYLVDGEIAGYAYATKHRERQAYKWSCDVSVYIANKYHRQSVGRVLYTELLTRVTEQGFCNAFAGITLPNASSVGLHESVGFKHIGTFEAVGFKKNNWHDVGWWQRKLNCSKAEPSSIRSPRDMGWL